MPPGRATGPPAVAVADLAAPGRTGAGLGLALVSAVAFGLSGPFAGALIAAGWSATGAVLVRLGGAAAILLVVIAVTRPGVLAALRADGPALLLYGVLAAAGVQVAFFNALQYLPVAIALLLEYLGPILVIGWVWLVRGQPPSARTVLGAVIALVGLSLVVQVWSGLGLRVEGVVWGLVAAVCQASYFLVADRAGSTTPPLVLAGVGMTIGTVVVALLGLLGALPIVVGTDVTGVVLAGVDVGWPVAATLLIVVSTVIAYLTGVAALARIGATRGSLIALLEVLVSAVASWLLLGQVLTPVQALGGALILAGLALTNTARPATLAEPG
ncbi:DMT family transporter [Pseudonocardia sp.]|uniref:EamA family transporter n=1 Tax=Pseudonocardia sp. TaxID=60912 RepID=UPI00261663BB|nr:DMT family transporter [Pseudonocardia sp.]